LLNDSTLRAVKTLILEENVELIRDIERYFNHEINLADLARLLKRKSDKLTQYIERPQSPTPKKDELM
jgi:hypothetical protein